MTIEKPSVYAHEADLPRDVKKIDCFESALHELFFIEHPTIRKHTATGTKAAEEFVSKSRIPSVWIHYPWLHVAVKIPEGATYQKIRTARNRNLITKEEQAIYRNAIVGIAGLSVGSTALSTLVSTGGPRRIKLADPDILELSNLNRIRASLPDLGMNKTDIAARLAWELDPFLDLELWREGLKKDSLYRFMAKPRLDVFIDEMDAIEQKIAARLECRRLKIPVVMATDNGDSVIVDVERFDLEPDREIFHGRITFDARELERIGPETFIEMASKIIDVSLFTKRQNASILEIGKTLSGVPQLGSAAAIAGATIAYATRAIVTGADMPSGRYVVGCETGFGH